VPRRAREGQRDVLGRSRLRRDPQRIVRRQHARVHHQRAPAGGAGGLGLPRHAQRHEPQRHRLDRPRDPAVQREQITMKRLLAFVASVAFVPFVAADTVIKDATILTISHGKIEHGSILIRGTKIAAVGPNDQVQVPAGATVIDAAGKFVMPGIVDTHSHTGVEGSVNEISLPNTGMVRIRDVLTNEDISSYRELAGGNTTALVLHGSANPIGGQSQIVKWKWGHPVSEWPVADAPRTIKFALGENPKSSNFRPPPGQPAQYPQTRMGVEEVIRQSFTDAKDYAAKW